MGAILPIVLGISAGEAQTTGGPGGLDELFTRLKEADAGSARRIERQIFTEWSKSGSPAADLLLERGRKAMSDGKNEVAIEHLTALVDHAPDFAEGWNARATAYFRAGMFGPSMSDIAHVLTLNPRHFGALAGLGTMLEQMERPEQALKAYRAALAIHPHLEGVVQAVDRLEAEAAGQEL
ncbi:tetratricopeptide repeat protein [Rhodobacter sp. NSM]|uniref:tetratricopeptide repeat protein n=1 Tax=Rhodobacter sp. NSM TaxID=3457501 RepID=UPI003FD29159